MIKKILIILLILISPKSFASIGDNSDFWIVSQNDYSKMVSKGQDVVLTRYIVVPDFDKKYKDILATNDEHALLAKFSFMLKKGNNARMDKYIKDCDVSLDINNLIKGLYYFSRKKYSHAIAYLEELNNEDFIFLKLLLIADCKSELQHDKKNYKSIIEAYQIAIDCTDNEQNKSIVNNRIKYIRYR